jgi:two-component system, probable response regulator PhcQ
MLTTAYSELGEAIEAINSGEIYRYITKPWELGSLHADLRNALELADLRSERDHLLGQKLMVQQQGLLGSRLAGLTVLGVGAVLHAATDAAADAGAPGEAVMHRYARMALQAGCAVPDARWTHWDQAGLLQAEARRDMVISRELLRWQRQFGSHRTPDQAMGMLAKALGTEAHDATVRLPSTAVLTGLLDGVPGEAPLPKAIAWLAWLLWSNAPVTLHVAAADAGAISVQWRPDAAAEEAPSVDWLERAIEQFAEVPPGP